MQNSCQHVVEIVAHVAVGETNDVKPTSLDFAFARFVADTLFICRMRSAVDLDHELSVEGGEIDDIASDRVLAAKFPTSKLASSQCFPEDGL